MSTVEEALNVFEQAYQLNPSIEAGIQALKRQGFSQINTIIVLMDSLEISTLWLMN